MFMHYDEFENRLKDLGLLHQIRHYCNKFLTVNLGK